jgi:flagellar biosynthesis protein FlhB
MPTFEGGQEDRTEAATPRRLQRAREEGQIPISRELASLAGLAGASIALLLLAPTAAADLTRHLIIFLGQAYALDLNQGIGVPPRLAALAALHAAAPVAFGTILAAAVAVLLQTGLLLNLGALRPSFSRVNPRAGLQRLFGANGLAEALKSCAKIALMTLIAWHVLAGDLAALLAAPFADAATLAARCARPVLHVLIAVLLAQTAIAAADLMWVRVRHARTMRMSRQDIRDEQKETEGDPQVRMRFRQLRIRRARKRMLAAVPKATVVITNPTHYAVALAYDRAKNAAPRVVAKGVDSMAARIRQVADANRVPLVVNAPLARALHRVDLDTDIPAEHYKAVAEIIAYVWRLGRGARRAARHAIAPHAMTTGASATVAAAGGVSATGTATGGPVAAGALPAGAAAPGASSAGASAGPP